MTLDFIQTPQISSQNVIGMFSEWIVTILEKVLLQSCTD